jgi:hypothetical protein
MFVNSCSGISYILGEPQRLIRCFCGRGLPDLVDADLELEVGAPSHAGGCPGTGVAGGLLEASVATTAGGWVTIDLMSDLNRGGDMKAACYVGDKTMTVVEDEPRAPSVGEVRLDVALLSVDSRVTLTPRPPSQTSTKQGCPVRSALTSHRRSQ